MSDPFAAVSDFSAVWATTMLRASLSGGLVILLVWALTRFWPRMPSSGRSWLWRVAFCKLVLALVCTASVGLPVLPGDSTQDFITTPVSVARARPNVSLPQNLTGPDALEKTEQPYSILAVNDPPPPPEIRPSPRVTAASGETDNAGASLPAKPVTVLLICWLAGGAACLWQGGRAWQVARRWRAEATYLEDPSLQAALQNLTGPFGLARRPELRISAAIDSIALTGAWRPVILIAPRLLERMPPEAGTPELELMLAHELAHQKRRDLVWNWLVWAGQTLFWFHPLVWLAARECLMAHEVACDDLALRHTQTPVAAYGAMLLKTAVTKRTKYAEGLFMAGVSERYVTLHKRLSAMRYFSLKTDSVRALTICAGLAALALVPWRLTTRPASAAAIAAREAAMAAQDIFPTIEPAFAADLDITVRDSAGKPISGAHVVINENRQALMDAGYLQFTTDESGRASITRGDFPRLRPYRAWVSVYAPGYALDTAELQSQKHVELTLRKPSTLRGLITDRKGRALPGVEVRLGGVKQGGAPGNTVGRFLAPMPGTDKKFTVRSDKNGVWTMGDLPDNGEASFVITDPRYASRRFRVTLRTGGCLVPTVPVMPGATIAGRVLFPNGKPAAGISIYVTGAGRGPSLVDSEGTGTYSVAGLGAEPAEIYAFDLDGNWVAPRLAPVKVAPGQVTRVPDIVLTRGSLLRGRVVDAVTGAPIPGANLVARFKGPRTAPGLNGFSFANSDFEGRYMIRVLPGQGTVSAGDGLSKGSGHVATPEIAYSIGRKEIKTLMLPMKPGSEPDGTAVDESGRPIDDSAILARPADINRYRLGLDIFSRKPSAEAP